MKKDETTLEYIANWIEKGCTSGYYPYWKLSFNDVQHNELSDVALQHIASAVVEGFIEGEVIVDCENPDNNGRWKLKTYE